MPILQRAPRDENWRPQFNQERVCSAWYTMYHAEHIVNGNMVYTTLQVQTPREELDSIAGMLICGFRGSFQHALSLVGANRSHVVSELMQLDALPDGGDALPGTMIYGTVSAGFKSGGLTGLSFATPE